MELDVEQATRTLRPTSSRARRAGVAQPSIGADQITVPILGTQISRTQAAVAGGALLLVLVLAARGGGSGEGFYIRRT